MLHTNWPTLRVINIMLNSKEPIKLSEPLRTLREITGSYAPETCSRQVYIYDERTVDDDTVKSHPTLALLNEFCEKTEIYHGAMAYQFLLKWTLGLKSNKLTQDDIFVRGQLRSRWTEYLESVPKDISQKILPFYQMLSEDATGIRACMNDGSYALGISLQDQRKALDVICNRCVELRAKGMNPNYPELQTNQNELMKQSLQRRLRRVTDELAVLQGMATSEANGVDILIPSLEALHVRDDDSQKANFGRLRKSFKLVCEKRELMAQLEQYAGNKDSSNRVAAL